jgi:hypothetical protein
MTEEYLFVSNSSQKTISVDAVLEGYDVAGMRTKC